MGGHIKAENTGRVKSYTVAIAYAGFDSHGDKIADSYGEPEVFVVELDAVTNIQAIVQAHNIVTQRRAEIMTDFMTMHPLLDDDPKTSFTIEEIEKIRQESEDRGVFRSWLSIEPTSIQCHLTEDTDKLFDMTRQNIDHITSGDTIAEDIQDYLKGSEE